MWEQHVSLCLQNMDYELKHVCEWAPTSVPVVKYFLFVKHPCTSDHCIMKLVEPWLIRSHKNGFWQDLDQNYEYLLYRKCVLKCRLHYAVSPCVLKWHHWRWIMINWWHDFMMTSSNGNIFRVTGPLCGEFTGHWWFPRTKASDAELWYLLWSTPE